MSDASEYVESIVIPCIRDFEKNQGSRRHAFIALVATYHTVDYLAFNETKRQVNKGRREALRKLFRGQCPGFKLIDQAAHAFKHVASDGREDERVAQSDVVEHKGEFSPEFSREFDIDRVYIEGYRDLNLVDLLKGAAGFLRNQMHT